MPSTGHQNCLDNSLRNAPRNVQGCLLKERWKPGKNEQSGYDEFMVKLSEAVRTVAASQNYFPGK